jgi:Dolichyl-phosphate-mannose-protein mannosyltransferase
MLIAVALVAGACLRLWFIHAYPQLNGDGLIYGDIAKNWLLHGVYGRTIFAPDGSRIAPTLIRLPGYPLFLALCFRVFGMEHYVAVLRLQAAIDLGACLVVAATARRIFSERTALFALFLGALCPFTANYVAAPLCETLSIFCVALGLYALTAFLLQPGWYPGALLVVTWSYATLLRPDGALLAVASFAAILLFAWRSFAGRPPLGLARAARYAIPMAALSMLPFVLWTARNWHVFHTFQPLAPRYATDPGEFTAPGFQHWTKTWAVDYASTYDIYWNANTDVLPFDAMPTRAFDSPTQYRETRELFSDYNAHKTLTPAIDARFESLARERERAHPLRVHVLLPLLRVLDMWFRPRTEMLDIELRWWEYWHHYSETVFAASYAALNLFYVSLAIVGVFRWPPSRATLLAAILIYIVLRSLLLADIEAPEARYTIECFPMLFLLGAAAVRQKQLPGSSS